ncbi:MAG: hypothetical protein ABW278_11590, partial [Steroidobacteraceae bacterium]
MKPIRTTNFAAAVITLLAAAQGQALAADTSGSQRVGDLQYGNALDPRGFDAASSLSDPLGLSLLRSGLS